MATTTGRFWKPGTAFPGVDTSSDRSTEKEGGISLVYNQHSSLPISQQRQHLPIHKFKTQILYILEKYRVLVVIGETGCGKTTQIPQYLLDAGWCSEQNRKCVACTQPRRISAVTVAQRVSEERGTTLGLQVGYAIQFDNRFDEEKTKIKYMTDGMLLREMMLDPLLSSYSVIMVDEAHERSLYTDILLGLLKKVMRKRKDLKLIVSSATIDAQLFKDFFEENISGDPQQDSVYILSIPGRTFPVQLYYTTSPVPNYLEACMQAVLNIHQVEDLDGDVLLFLTGQDEIDKFINMILEKVSEMRNIPEMQVLPLYSGLPMEQQMLVFAEDTYSVDGLRKSRKVIVSTNVAETSVTIPSITYVVDSGFVKQRAYDPYTETELLVVTEVSKASAQQRSGRAGRTRPGKCYRMYTEADYAKLSAGNIPEIQRSNLVPIVLQLKALGIDNIAQFPFISPPPSENMIRALELLYALEAIDDNGHLRTPMGLRMAEFPVEPQISKMLLTAGPLSCTEELLTIAAMLSVQNVFINVRGAQDASDRVKRKFAVTEGDHMTYLNIYTSFLKATNQPKWCSANFVNYKSLARAVSIRKQLTSYLKKYNIPILSAYSTNTNYDRLESPSELIRKCVLAGYFNQAAFKQSDGSYLTVRGKQTVFIHPSSVLFKFPPDWIVFSDIVHTSKIYVRDVMSIDPEWLPEVAPHFYENAISERIKKIDQNNSTA